MTKQLLFSLNSMCDVWKVPALYIDRAIINYELFARGLKLDISSPVECDLQDHGEWQENAGTQGAKWKIGPGVLQKVDQQKPNLHIPRIMI